MDIKFYDKTELEPMGVSVEDFNYLTNLYGFYIPEKQNPSRGKLCSPA
jgi:hypothetical protein